MTEDKWQVPVDEVLAREMLQDHSNVEIQAKTNISNRQLRLLRKKLGIPSVFKLKIDWDTLNDTGELSAESFALKHGLKKDTVFRNRKRRGIKCTAHIEMRSANAPKHISEQRICLACEDVFLTKSVNHLYCSSYCKERICRELRVLGMKQSEIENPSLRHMLFQINDKLVSGKTYTPWRKHLNELFVSTEEELRAKFGATHRSICVARLRLRKKWEQLTKNEKTTKKERITNETQQTQPANESARQLYDPATQRNLQKRGHTKRRCVNALPDTTGESGAQAGQACKQD